MRLARAVFALAEPFGNHRGYEGVQADILGFGARSLRATVHSQPWRGLVGIWVAPMPLRELVSRYVAHCDDIVGQLLVPGVTKRSAPVSSYGPGSPRVSC